MYTLLLALTPLMITPYDAHSTGMGPCRPFQEPPTWWLQHRSRLAVPQTNGAHSGGITPVTKLSETDSSANEA